MGFFKKRLNKDYENGSADLESVRRKFRNFYSILEYNNQILKVISDMEEKSHGEYLFDINYIETSVSRIREYLVQIIDNLVELGGANYSPLIDRCDDINNRIEAIVKGRHIIPEEDYTINLSKLDCSKMDRVGGKNARLGDLKGKIGIPVPDGFAITTWAYKVFLEQNNLQEQISKRINLVDIQDYEDLEKVSSEIRELISNSPVPVELVDEIMESYRMLKKQKPDVKNVSVRSSAIGEDAQLSYAGQYATYLNVTEDRIIDRYRDVLASKFTPKAIFYFLSHSVKEKDIALSVGCVEMINAKSSGVIYTRNPIDPESDVMVINSIYGLGKYLVSGLLTPDVYTIDRQSGKILNSVYSKKEKLIRAGDEGDIIEDSVPEELQQSSSLSEDEIKMLYGFAMEIEDHYDMPQDIEFAIDKNGEPYILQTRPLRLIRTAKAEVDIDLTSYEKIISGGWTICPGGGTGKVHHVSSSSDMNDVPNGAVLVTPNPFPGLITAMSKASAIISKIGSGASHAATIAREYRIPTIAGIDTSGLEEGKEITVDATNGVIYKGCHYDLVDALKPDYDYLLDNPLFQILENALKQISPLNLILPDDQNFTIDNCETIHDVTRFAHQKAVVEMFRTAQNLSKKHVGIRLDTDIPLELDLIYIDKDPEETKDIKSLKIDDVESCALRAFWGGVLEEGWPFKPARPNVEGFRSVVSGKGSSDQPAKQFSQISFAILSSEFMVLSLKMGYHFSTIEAMCTKEPNKNYIKLQFKEGGASPDRRKRRIKLVSDIISKLGFLNHGRDDFLDSTVSYESQDSMFFKLRMLGRLSMMTKQLDMTLTNDAITKWYTNEFLKKLGLKKKTIN